MPERRRKLPYGRRHSVLNVRITTAAHDAARTYAAERDISLSKAIDDLIATHPDIRRADKDGQ